MQRNKRQKQQQNLIHWRKKYKRRKRRKEAHKGIKMNFDVCDRTGSCFSGLVMRLSTNLFLEFKILCFTRQLATFQKERRDLYRNSMRCVFPIALRTFSNARENLNTCENFLNWNHCLFCLFSLYERFPRLSCQNRVWFEWRKDFRMVTPNPSNKSFKSFHHLKPSRLKFMTAW